MTTADSNIAQAKFEMELAIVDTLAFAVQGKTEADCNKALDEKMAEFADIDRPEWNLLGVQYVETQVDEDEWLLVASANYGRKTGTLPWV